MDKRGGKSSNPLELPSGKSRKDDARRPGNKARTKDGGTSEVLPRNLLRASGPEPVAGSTATAPQDPTLAATGSSNSVSSVSSTRASTTVASSGRGTQASLADYPQTAPTVSTLTELGSARQPRLDKSNVGEGQKKKARLDLNEYKYRQNLSLSSAQNMSSPLPSYPSPVRKTPWSGTGISSPSPPPTRRAGTPLLDEGPRDDLHQYQQYQGLLPGIPQGSSFQPGPFLETPRGRNMKPVLMLFLLVVSCDKIFAADSDDDESVVYSAEEEASELAELKRFAENLSEEHKALLERFLSETADREDLIQLQDDFSEANFENLLSVFELAKEKNLL